jgi:hypothetical protein
MTKRYRRLLAPLAVLVLAGGCSKTGLVEATGRLTYKGQPVPSTYVVFQPEEDGKRPSQGITDDEGNFKLLSSTTASGVYVGRHTVILKYYVSAEEELGKAPPRATREMKAAIVKYGDARTSNLKYEVTKSGQVFEINIE